MDINKAIQSALAYYQAGNLQDAEHLYKEILRVQPDNRDALHFLGVICYELGNYDFAIEHIKKALQINPSNAYAYFNLGDAFRGKGQFDEAIICYQKALKINPNLADAYYNLATILEDKGRFDEAILSYQKALQINPNDTDAWYNMGILLKEKGQLDEAVSCYQKALQINPNLADAYNNLGITLQQKGQLNEAITCYQKALKINPDLADAHYNLGIAHLFSGNFKEGWEGYEFRWELKDSARCKFSQPLWDGSSLTGKTLFVYDEQGVGDEIMFASCLPEVIAQTNLCLLETDKRLVPLFARSFPGAMVVERIKEGDVYPSELPPVDIRIAIGSLPKFLRPNLTSFPQQKAYLIPDSKQVEVWSNRFKLLGKGLKVGISWRGGKHTDIQRIRSTVLSQWNDILTLPGTYFINLQYGDCSSELREAHGKLGITIHNWKDAEPLKDLDGFAAQIAALDLVISVDNATVHMAGALGVPVWTLLPFSCEWRWMLKFEDTPWYKNMRLFRQKMPDDWDEVFKRVSLTLGKFIGKHIMPDIDPQCTYKHFRH
jgi:tetratricopeptide (TPR) repeat protein